MLKTLGLDEAALAREQWATLRDMQQLCSLCEASGRCQRELDAGTAAAHYHSFCNSAERLDELKALQKQ